VVEGVQCYAGHAQLDAFLAASRVLVCLLPLTQDTANILNRDTLARLQPGGYVINVVRGAHLVDADLLALLDSGHLAGATLDAFRTEPLPSDHPFWRYSQIHITPHISARTLPSDSLAQIITKLQALLQGQPVAGVVEPERGY
jgi:glyoxylate/hydroxypyruvate reductase A